MAKNGMRPVHPGEVLREDYLVPLNMSANALAKALNVPAPRINDIVRERRGVSAAGVESASAARACARTPRRERGYGHAAGTLLRWRRALMAEFAVCIRLARGGDREREADRARDCSCCGVIPGANGRMS